MKALWLHLIALLCVATVSPAAAQENMAAHMLSPGSRFGEQSGAALYANVCAACHLADAKGAVGAAAYPALAGDANLAAAGFAVSVVVEGLRGMPPVGRRMSDAQVADVVNYVRSHFGNRYADAVAPADVKAARPTARPSP